MRPPPSVPRHFRRDVILTFIAIGVIVIAAVAFFSIKAQRDISQKYIDGATMRAAESFQRLVEGMSRDLGLLRDWTASGKLSLSDTDGLNGMLFPMLKRDRVLYGISVADTRGENYYVADVGDGWRTSRTGSRGGNRETVKRFWDAEQRSTSEESTPAQYDPRQRPWFNPALSSKTVYWTQPYRFFDQNEVGFTAALATPPGPGGVQTVVAFDILLGRLFDEIQAMAPSENSRVLIFRHDAQLYLPGADGGSPEFRAVGEMENELIQKVFAAWSRDAGHPVEAYTIVHGNARWWCGFRALDRVGKRIWIGVMVPESDIIGGVNLRRTGIWSIGAGILLAAGVLAFGIIRRYGRSFEDPVLRFDAARPGESIRALIAAGEGRTIEFKSTMRMNLHTGKAGKEIEIAWLKAVSAFLNTDGGTLLLGVADDGAVTGLTADQFANDDKCRLHFKNLINQHIGAEFSKYLQFSLVTVDDRQVGVVTCRRAAEPAFLKTGKTEGFYIRSGPSSDELPVSKVVAYIQGRK